MFEGRNQLIKRLSYQLGSEEMALNVLKQRGHVDASGNLTASGRLRDSMTAGERAKDRHPRNSNQLQYNRATNRATVLPQFRRKARNNGSL